MVLIQIKLVNSKYFQNLLKQLSNEVVKLKAALMSPFGRNAYEYNKLPLSLPTTGLSYNNPDSSQN